MSTLDDEYADRLSDLLEDMEGDGVDSVQMMMSWLAGYVKGRMEGNEAEAYLFQFEDADMLIQITDPEEINAARLH